MSIKWGEVEFEGPYPITDWEPPHGAAVYAIMMKPHPQMKVHKFIYFGESGNLSERGFYRAHHFAISLIAEIYQWDRKNEVYKIRTIQYQHYVLS